MSKPIDPDRLAHPVKAAQIRRGEQARCAEVCRARAEEWRRLIAARSLPNVFLAYVEEAEACAAAIEGRGTAIDE